MKKNKHFNMLTKLVILLTSILFLFTGCKPEEIETEITVDLTSQKQTIVAQSEHQSVTLNGSSTSAVFSLDIKEGTTPLYLYLNSVNAIGEDGVYLISCTSGREIHIVVSGQNTLNALHNVAINCSSSDIYFEGDGVLTVIGGTGQSGNDGEKSGEDGTAGINGYEALIAKSVTVSMTSTLTLTGGNGGDGGDGASGANGSNGNDKGWLQSPTTGTGNTEHGGDGGDGGDGAKGGKGADAVRINSLMVNSGKVILNGGNGGSAGNGGKGGKGGHGGKNDWWVGYQGGHPGNGGNGGNGGDGSYGGNIELEKTLLIFPENALVEIVLGNNGSAGSGGSGGHYGDASGDTDGDVYYEPSSGKAGKKGTPVE